MISALCKNASNTLESGHFGRRGSSPRPRSWLVVLALALVACGSEEPPRSADTPAVLESDAEAPAPGDETRRAPGFPETSVDAQLDTYEQMKSDLSLERHPSDGGGKAWLRRYGAIDGPPGVLRVLDQARFEIVYEAGPLGIDVGGEVQLQVSPFWQWDPPQTRDRNRRGYTQVGTTATGVELQPVWYGTELLAIGIAGRRLEAGEQLFIFYGAGEPGARIDAYAEREERLWIAVDGNGDGIRKFLADSPSFDIGPGPANFLHAVTPTTLEPGEAFELLIAVLDHEGNAGIAFEGSAEIDVPSGVELATRVEFAAADLGHKRVAGVAREAGVYRIPVRVTPRDGPENPALRTRTNPMIVEPGIARVHFGDVHGHSNLSDGTGTPEDYFRYARDYAGLDFVALTDHDHWGIRFLDQHPEMWERIQSATRENNAPGLFTTLLGYEWTSWLHGHRHVLYFEDRGEVYSSMDGRYETPRQLWDALEGQPAMTFAHHSAGGPISTNWAYPPDPVLEPLTEIVSVHGVSESYDAPGTIYNPVRGNFVRDALHVGYRFGFIGSGDSHDGHPGLAHVANDGGSGLAAVFSEKLDRESLLKAMRARHTYATNGARSFIEVSIDGVPMGGTLPPWEEGAPDMQTLSIRVIGESAIQEVEVVRSGATSKVELGTALQWSVEREIPRLRRGEYHYVRVVEASGAMAWSSPIFAD